MLRLGRDGLAKANGKEGEPARRDAGLRAVPGCAAAGLDGDNLRPHQASIQAFRAGDNRLTGCAAIDPPVPEQVRRQRLLRLAQGLCGVADAERPLRLRKGRQGRRLRL